MREERYWLWTFILGLVEGSDFSKKEKRVDKAQTRKRKKKSGIGEDNSEGLDFKSLKK